MTNSYISSCTYDKFTDPLCPVFTLRTVLEEAEPDGFEREQMLLKGDVVQIEVIWNCNLDYRGECHPKYSFSRFEMPFKNSTAATGFNFRYSFYLAKQCDQL
jgi:hypothetical protein